MSGSDVLTTGTIGDAVNEILSKDSEESREYLKERMITGAVLALFEQRKSAGLTQTEIAQRLGTKQPAISALEADFSGSFSFRRYVDYLMACNALPLDLSFAPIDGIRRFLLSESNGTPTAINYAAWCDARPTISGLHATVQDPSPAEEPPVDWQALATQALNDSGNSLRQPSRPQRSPMNDLAA